MQVIEKSIRIKEDACEVRGKSEIAAKTFPAIGRLSLGYYRGMNGKLFVDENGDEAQSGIIAAWERMPGDKVRDCVDYASGKSWYGSLSFGVSYAFGSNASVIFGYVLFNNDKIMFTNVFATQLDINL